MEVLRKSTKIIKIADVPIEIRTEHRCVKLLRATPAKLCLQ
jgi:hypothetical protein